MKNVVFSRFPTTTVVLASETVLTLRMSVGRVQKILEVAVCFA